jgi:SH3 domain protein
LISPLSLAETQYIHDVLRVDMRSGPTSGYRIVNFLRSGTPVEVLGRSDDGEWVQVRAQGREGWVQSQYLSKERIAKDLLEEAQQRASSLQQRNQTLTTQLNTAQTELKQLREIQQQMQATEQTVRKELENLRLVSRDAIETSRNFQAQATQIKLLEVELEKLSQENIQLKENTMVDGIKWGAMSVIAGALLALMIPKMTTRKRRSEW